MAHKHFCFSFVKFEIGANRLRIKFWEIKLIFLKYMGAVPRKAAKLEKVD